MDEIIEKVKKTPIEVTLQIDDEGYTTSKKLYEWLELDQSHYSRWCRNNILENPFAESGIDYSPCGASKGKGNFAEDYRLSADFANLERDIKLVESNDADWIHVDVMDGHFVPNITIGAPVVRCLKNAVSVKLDSHLMIENPLKYIPDFIEAGSDIITFHIEAAKDTAAECVSLIKNAGRHGMQGEFAVAVYNGMACICSSLESDDDIRFLGQHIRYLPFPFISPVSSNNSCYHNIPPFCRFTRQILY